MNYNQTGEKDLDIHIKLKTKFKYVLYMWSKFLEYLRVWQYGLNGDERSPLLEAAHIFQIKHKDSVRQFK